MQIHRYHETYAESWLSAARDKVIDGVQRMTDTGGLSKGDYFRMVLAVKADCLAAAFLGLFAATAAGIEALWYSAKHYLFHGADANKLDNAWDEFHRAIDVVISGVSALFDSNAVLTAADRGNIRKICDIGRKIQDVQADPDMNPDTKKELETWYRSAKVFMRMGGDEITKEMQGLSRALEHISATPDTEPEKLRAWRWDTSLTHSSAAEKIKGISWMAPEHTAPTEDITKRTWKKKAS